MVDLDDEAARVLAALVEGYRAREGMKPRTRPLSEYELGRRLGVTGYSYAEFERSPERTELLRSLELLVLRGLAQRGSPSGRYDTYAPVEDAGPATPPAPARPAPDGRDALLERVSQQLDDVLALLRSIDRKLGPE